MPLIPSQGSVGLSGDLAPLAHLIAALMGYGRIDVAGEVMSAAAALERLGLEPLQLGPKEGLALINGTQASTALALDALFQGSACSPPRSPPAPCRSMHSRVRPSHSIRASPRFVANQARSGLPRRSPACSRAARSSPAM